MEYIVLKNVTATQLEEHRAALLGHVVALLQPLPPKQRTRVTLAARPVAEAPNTAMSGTDWQNVQPVYCLLRLPRNQSQTPWFCVLDDKTVRRLYE